MLFIQSDSNTGSSSLCWSCVWNQRDTVVFFFLPPPCGALLYAGRRTAGVCHGDLLLCQHSRCYRNLNRRTEPWPRCLLPDVHMNISHVHTRRKLAVMSHKGSKKSTTSWSILISEDAVRGFQPPAVTCGTNRAAARQETVRESARRAAGLTCEVHAKAKC